jgi:hypothetical protein
MFFGSKKLFIGLLTATSMFLVACSAGEPANAVSPASSSTSQQSTSTAGSATAALDELTVKGRAPKTGYSRNSFGSAWKDVDKNGCDTRNDILQRDLDEKIMQNKCVVTSGVLYPDPYTGTNIIFTRGKSQIDIDHVVALSDAWQKGAFAWDQPKREAFANDPLNLLAVQARANRQKGDADAATWLPSNKSYRCDYVARQIAVKQKYDVWVTQAEKDAMQRVLNSCPDQTLPQDGVMPTKPQVDTGSSDQNKGQDKGNNSSSSTNDSSTVKRYKNCTEAREAGVTPLRKGDGVYELNTHLDRDKDGVACNR